MAGSPALFGSPRVSKLVAAPGRTLLLLRPKMQERISLHEKIVPDGGIVGLFLVLVVPLPVGDRLGLLVEVGLDAKVGDELVAAAAVLVILVIGNDVLILPVDVGLVDEVIAQVPTQGPSEVVLVDGHGTGIVGQKVHRLEFDGTDVLFPEVGDGVEGR